MGAGVSGRGVARQHTRPEDGRGAGTLLQRGSEGRPEMGALGPPTAQRAERGVGRVQRREWRLGPRPWPRR